MCYLCGEHLCYLCPDSYSEGLRKLLHSALEPEPRNCSGESVRLSPSQKLTGLLVPVFALRSESDLGIGDTECVRQTIDWCAKHSISLLQLLPINESGDDNSPYNAISSMALDPTTIAISPSLISDLSEKSFKEIASEALLKDLRKGPVQYRKIKALKRDLLKDAFQSFLKKHDAKDTARAQEFRSFLSKNASWIADYGLFRTLMGIHQNLPVWEQWPAEHQTVSQARTWILTQPTKEREEIEQTILFYCYVQWIARQQWEDLKAYGAKKKVYLMGDIPFGIGRYSADVWSERALFDLRWSCGAPPETFFKPDLFTERWGQNWGIPLYRWSRMKEDNYRWWRSRIQGTSEIFHYFRIDHVLGFYRIYAFPWKPEDNDTFTNLSREQALAKVGALPRFWPGDDNIPDQRTVNHQQGEELLHVVLEAAGETSVVAEDLGMVPDYVRPSLTQMGIPGFKIPIFERNQDGSYKNSNEYIPLSVVTFATHDHEPMAALWKRWQTAQEGVSEKRHLLQWIGWDPEKQPQEFTPELHAAICKKILQSSSQFAVFMITDLFAETQRFNVPGPMSDSNWTERLPISVAEFSRNPEIVSVMKSIDRLIPESGR
jgi:4-alpha-glucanotransferase